MAENKSGASEAALGWGIMLCVFAGLSYLVWWFFAEQIRSVIRWIRYAEMWAASLFVGDDYTVPWDEQPINYNQLRDLAAALPADRIDNSFLAVLSAVAMMPYIYVITAIAVTCGFWALFKGPGTEHRTKFDLNGLIKKQANIFPIIAPFINFNPATMPPRPPGAPVPSELPPFAEALSPEEWVVYNEIPVIDKKIDEDAAQKAFTKQLGERWRGAKNLAPYKQVMLAAMCLKAARKRSDSDIMMGKLALCWSHEKGLKIDGKLLREARSVLSNANIAGNVLKKCNQHAWETTAMIRALATAREEGGVLAPAQFVWLRAYDRTLWYPLNNLGRQSLHMEALGAMAHYKAEKMAQRPIPHPKMADAVKSLKDYIGSPQARALPQLDYSTSKKGGIKKLKTA